MLDLRKAKSLLFGAAVTISLGACATTVSAPVSGEALQTDTVSEIVTGGVRQGRVEFIDGCLYLQTDQWRYVAFFRQGTVLDEATNSMILPDGQRIVVGKSYPLLLEYYPTLRNANPACDGPNAIIRTIGKGE